LVKVLQVALGAREKMLPVAVELVQLVLMAVLAAVEAVQV
jgi:hypothetical protein